MSVLHDVNRQDLNTLQSFRQRKYQKLSPKQVVKAVHEAEEAEEAEEGVSEVNEQTVAVSTVGEAVVKWKVFRRL